MGRGQAVKVVTLDILNIFTPSEQVIQILRFTPLQPNRKKIPIKKAENVGMQGKHRKEKKNGILQKRKIFRVEKKT